MSESRQTADNLFETLETWDKLLTGRGKIRLIACGGTALTLLGLKASTKDIDFLVPDKKEFAKLITFMESAGYERLSGHKWKRPDEVLEYDIFQGSVVFMTELLSSPLEKDGHKVIREYAHITLAVLNSYDWIITKLARGTRVDIDDCLILLKSRKLDLKKLRDRFEEAAKYSINYGINETQAMKNYDWLMDEYKKK